MLPYINVIVSSSSSSSISSQPFKSDGSEVNDNNGVVNNNSINNNSITNINPDSNSKVKGQWSVAVNEQYVYDEMQLNNGDELAIIPPISGG